MSGAPNDSSQTPRLREIFALTRRLAKLHRALGIPSRYAVDRKLAPHFEAAESDLVVIGQNEEGRPIRLARPAAEAWIRMHDAAARDRLELIPISGFRSIERQAEIIRDRLAAGAQLAEILRTVAAPGFSEHHTGRAIDIGSPEHIELDEEFARTAAFRWLERRAGDFGFGMSYPHDNPHRIAYEPWHWCWDREKPGTT